MQVSQIIREIDNEIARLKEARILLAGGDNDRGHRAIKVSSPAKKKTRKLSAEGRRKIGEAMKRRWAERRKQAAAANGKNEKASSGKGK